MIGSSTESGDTGRIDYDDKAISGLLDRDRSQQDEVQEDEDKMFANEYLASFKVRGETERERERKRGREARKRERDTSNPVLIQVALC